MIYRKHLGNQLSMKQWNQIIVDKMFRSKQKLLEYYFETILETRAIILFFQGERKLVSIPFK